MVIPRHEGHPVRCHRGIRKGMLPRQRTGFVVNARILPFRYTDGGDDCNIVTDKHFQYKTEWKT